MRSPVGARKLSPYQRRKLLNVVTREGQTDIRGEPEILF